MESAKYDMKMFVKLLALCEGIPCHRWFTLAKGLWFGSLTFTCRHLEHVVDQNVLFYSQQFKILCDEHDTWRYHTLEIHRQVYPNKNLAGFASMMRPYYNYKIEDICWVNTVYKIHSVNQRKVDRYSFSVEGQLIELTFLVTPRKHHMDFLGSHSL